MNRRISQGQAIRSVLGRARVTHFMVFLLGWKGVGLGGESGQVEVAAGDLVAGDRPVVDGLVDVGGGEGSRSGVAIQASNTSWEGQTVTTTVSPSPLEGSSTSSARMPWASRTARPSAIQAR